MSCTFLLISKRTRWPPDVKNIDFWPVLGPAEEVDVPVSSDAPTSTLPVASSSAFRFAFSLGIFTPFC